MSKARCVLIAAIIPFTLAVASCASPSPTATPGTSDTAAPSTPAPSAPATAADTSGVTVTGAFGKMPTVNVKPGFFIGETQVRVVHQGTGHTVGSNATVKVNYYGVNGRDGAMFEESFSSGSPVEFSLDQVIPGFQKGLQGQKVGSRVLIAVPGSDGYDATGGSQDGKIQVGDTLLFVVDIMDASYDMASGTEVTPKEGLPTVVFTDGKPTITVPAGDPPSELVVQPLIIGKGPKVTADAMILVKYTGVSWKSGEVIEENWTTGESSVLSKLIPGWQRGIAGQTVGSRVLLVIPPELGYPDGRRQPKVEPGDTLIYVVDILYAADATA